MQSFNPMHLIVIIAICVIGAGLIFKGDGVSDQVVSVAPAATVAAYVPTPAQKVGTANISHAPQDVPPPLTRTENQTVKVALDAVQLVAEIADGTTYEYWTYNKTVPGPMVRVLEGDIVEVSVTHKHDHMVMSDEERALDEELFGTFSVSGFVSIANAQGMPAGMDMSNAAHMAAGHGEHSVDFHAAQGALGGADGSRAAPNETKTFTFKAAKPGLYIYHCGSPHVPTHIANGMYGMILVEPKGGLAKVDHEYYLVEGELYTSGPLGQKGHQTMSKEKLLNEAPEYVTFNGKPGAVTGDRALTAKVGETVRLFVGAAGQVTSNFHVIGEVFDRVYREGDLVSPPAQFVQTTLVPAGGATMVEFGVDYPGKYVFVDHALSRAVDRGAAGHLIVTGDADPSIYKGEIKASTGH